MAADTKNHQDQDFTQSTMSHPSTIHATSLFASLDFKFCAPNKQRYLTWAIVEKTNCESAAVYTPPFETSLGRSSFVLL